MKEFIGFKSEKTDKKFLPVFKTKQDAKACFALMPKDLFKGKYDVHAMIEDDILVTAKEKGYHTFLVDEEGKILKQLG